MSKEYKAFHIISVKYLGATNSRGSRIKLSSKRFNQSITIPYNYSENSALEGAITYLRVNKFPIVGYDGWSDSIIVKSVDSTFKPLKELA